MTAHPPRMLRCTGVCTLLLLASLYGCTGGASAVQGEREEEMKSSGIYGTCLVMTLPGTIDDRGGNDEEFAVCPGAEVVVRGLAIDSVLQRTVADSLGKFRVRLHPGKYRIQAAFNQSMSSPVDLDIASGKWSGIQLHIRIAAP